MKKKEIYKKIYNFLLKNKDYYKEYGLVNIRYNIYKNKIKGIIIKLYKKISKRKTINKLYKIIVTNNRKIVLLSIKQAGNYVVKIYNNKRGQLAKLERVYITEKTIYTLYQINKLLVDMKYSDLKDNTFLFEK